MGFTELKVGILRHGTLGAGNRGLGLKKVTRMAFVSSNTIIILSSACPHSSSPHHTPVIIVEFQRFFHRFCCPHPSIIAPSLIVSAIATSESPYLPHHPHHHYSIAILCLWFRVVTPSTNYQQPARRPGLLKRRPVNQGMGDAMADGSECPSSHARMFLNCDLPLTGGRTGVLFLS